MIKRRNVKRYKDMTGEHFGKLIVLSYAYIKESSRMAMWNVSCECGTQKIVSGNSLRMGTSKSCGCESVLQLEKGRGYFKGQKIPERSGANCHLWRGGITPKNRAARTTLEYKQWRTAVFERDNYACIKCGQIGGKLNADHIKPFCAFKKLRLDISNGRTLCESCHRKTDTWGEGAKKHKQNVGILA
jgi:5-methylcytosine-specific restriction endonuclease McrA